MCVDWVNITWRKDNKKESIELKVRWIVDNFKNKIKSSLISKVCKLKTLR